MGSLRTLRSSRLRLLDRRRPLSWMLAIALGAWAALDLLRPLHAPVQFFAVIPSGARWEIEADVGEGFERAYRVAFEPVADPQVGRATLRLKRVRALRLHAPGGVPMAGTGAAPRLAVDAGAGRGLARLLRDPIDADHATLSPIPELHRIRPPGYVLAQLLAALLVASAAVTAIHPIARRRARRRLERALGGRSGLRAWAGLTAAGTAICLLWLAGEWPGYLIHDYLSAHAGARQGTLFDWYSYLYPLLLMVVHQGSEHPAFLGLLQALAATAVSAAWLLHARARGAPGWSCLYAFGLLWLSPLNATMTLSYNRDPIFSWLLVALALAIPIEALARARTGGREPGAARLAAIGFLLAVVSRLRMESVPLLALFPLLAWRSGAWSGRTTLWFLGWAAAPAALLHLALPAALRIQPAGIVYRATGIANPLGYLLRHPHHSPSPSEDARVIDRVMDVARLMEDKDPLEIPVLHEGGMRLGATYDDWDAAKRVYLRLIADNPALFAANRAMMATALLGLDRALILSDGLRERGSPMQDEYVSATGAAKRPLWAPLGPFLEEVTRRTLGFRGLLAPQAWVGSNLLPLLLLLGMVFRHARAPATAAACALILLRLSLVLLTAPAAQFKYAYSVYLMAFVALPFHLAEARARARGAAGANLKLLKFPGVSADEEQKGEARPANSPTRSVP